jgi:Ca2+-binding RTX toxin-like protein
MSATARRASAGALEAMAAAFTGPPTGHPGPRPYGCADLARRDLCDALAGERVGNKSWARRVTVGHPSFHQGGTVLHHSAAVAATALIVGALLTPAPATAVGEMCQGREATIVGVGPDIRGTAGDDVIVTGASKITYAEAGNDLVCVTPSATEGTYVDAGAGDDVVDATAATTPVSARLRAGLDRYIGGSLYGEVRASGADDQVLGARWVTLEIGGPVTGPTGTYSGSSIHVWSASQDVEVQLDQRVVVGGVHAADITGFTGASVHAPRVVLVGDAKDNSLSVRGCDTRVEGADGNDYIGAHAYRDDGQPKFDCPETARLSGGPGDDHLRGSDGRDRLTGGAGNDALEGRPDADVLLGGKGKDLLKGGGDRDVLRGNGGNDVLIGNPGADTLLGNGGRDRADGHHGRDTCVAERERRCER